ncbi:YTH domain-containing family protein 2-like [Canna indica]|uniref:YTH domain-containing family protein n=1 Tax=Canna indica TaxID=4628 RepID=A0AAQ3QG38_9LILI|nr:YTH domain-containing family protein 2-like [Canna indica]
MATDAPAPPADKAADLMQNLSLDKVNKSNDASETTKKPSGVPNGSANGAELPMAPMPTTQRSLTPLLQEHADSSMCYLPNGYTSPIYYGGYDGSMAEWEEYPRYVSPDGLEVPPLGVYGDLYHHGYSYAPYSPYPTPGSPVPALGHNNQLYGSQHYQYPATYYQPPTSTGAPNTKYQTTSSKGDVSTSAAADLPSVSVDTTKANSNGVAKSIINSNNEPAKSKPSQQNGPSNVGGSFSKGTLAGGVSSSGYQDPRFGFDGMWSPVPWYDGTTFADGQQRPVAASSTCSATSHVGNNTSSRNQNLHPIHLMGMHAPSPAAAGMVGKVYSNNPIYGQHANGFGNCQSFHSSMYDPRMNGRWGMSMDGKYKPRGRGNGFFGYVNDNMDGLGELNKGPRSGRFRNQKGFGSTITLAVRGQSLPINVNIQDSAAAFDRDQYNKTDFSETYADAKFFIIKSYSEDDIHKSIKYSVWASTPHGNKKLDAAYQESKDKSTGCPIFLFFSVNTSGQFVGVAEMVGPVDFNKTFDYWQQDKWIGCFPVKWHIVKDVPNSILKHIILENNDNKPVTNSRDTQEVKLEQGLQLLKLFKEHAAKTSVLDDFSFYETRQKLLQEKRSRQHHLQKKTMDSKPTHFDDNDKDEAVMKPELPMPLGVVTLLKKETTPSRLGSGDQVLSENNVVATVAGSAPLDSKAASEKRGVANGVANCC